MPARTPGPVDLEAALQGRSPTLAAEDAVYPLARAAGAGAKERLARLLREKATPAIRRRAALALSLLADGKAALLDSLDTDEPSVLAAVLLSLARIGTADDLKAIRAAATRLSGHPAQQARFAELLLAHRLGLGLDVVPPIPTPPASQVPVHATAVTMGSPEEAARAWTRFMPNASLGFDPDIQQCSMIHCARRSVLVIPSTALREGAQRLLKERMLVGATAAFERETASWHHDLWILSTPAADGTELQAWTQGGRPSYAGSGRVTGGDAAFEFRTADTSRLALVHVSGRLTKAGIAIEGTVGSRDPADSRAPVSRLRAE